jgi:hypothetical protein
MGSPQDVAVDASGNVVIADNGFSDGPDKSYGAQLRVVAKRSGTFYGRKMIGGDIYSVAGHATGVGFSGDGGPATKAALGESIGGVRVDRAGNLVFGDDSDFRVRVVAAHTGRFYGKNMTAGDIYTVAGMASAASPEMAGRPPAPSFAPLV